MIIYNYTNMINPAILQHIADSSEYYSLEDIEAIYQNKKDNI